MNKFMLGCKFESLCEKSKRERDNMLFKNY